MTTTSIYKTKFNIEMNLDEYYKPMSLIEISWRATQQIAISDEGHDLSDGVDGWGSGTFLNYKGKLVFLTADHVVHYDDHAESNETGKRLDKDDDIYIITNVTDPSGQLSFQPIGGIYSFDEYRVPEEEDLTEDDIEFMSIPDMKDCAFSFISHDIKTVTHALTDIDPNVILVEKKLPKICFHENGLNLGDPVGLCLVSGTVRNRILEVSEDDGMKRKELNRRNIFHVDLTYSGSKNYDGDYIFNYPQTVYQAFWAGISGAPVIDEGGRLVGVVVRAVSENNTIIVKPISEILHYISYAIDIENRCNIK